MRNRPDGGIDGRLLVAWRRAAVFAGMATGLLLSSALPTHAQASLPPPAYVPTASHPSLRPEAIGPFLDRVLPTQLALFGIPGAAVAVVQGGTILHLGGYGRADLRHNTPVSARDTLFRVGSVSKLLTWTAVMQSVEKDRLDLDADVNEYLDTLQVPATYPEPVTLARLLTHTAGFEDRAFGSYARSGSDLIPLGAFLAANMPARIFPPGEVSAYSNYGAALAGHLVERVSGMPFEEYVEVHIVGLLGMTSTTFRQPPPPSLAARLATGYRPSLEPGAFEWDLAVPAGALSSTAADMARFMIAHLQHGRVGAARLLGKDIAESMQRRQFTNHPAVSGLTYGFQELHLAGQRVLSQPGDMLHFTASLFLLPAHDLGLFVAYNRGRAEAAPMALIQVFLDRFLPAPSWLGMERIAPPERDVSRFAGSYRSTRRNETTLEKLKELFSPVRVRAVGPGTLQVSGLAVVPESLWTAITPGVFRDQTSPEVIAFRADAAGRMTHLFEGNFPAAGYSRLPWYGAPEVHYGLLATSVLVFLLTPVIWSAGTLRHPGAHTSLARRARLTSAALCGVNLLFLVGMVVVIAQGRELLHGVTPFARVVLVLPLLSAGLTALTLVLSVIALRQHFWSLAGRMHYLLVVVVGLAFLGSLHYWNLLGFRF